MYAGDEFSEDRKDQLRHAFSHLVSVCTQLTQEPRFKANYISIIENILIQAQSNSTTVSEEL